LEGKLTLPAAPKLAPTDTIEIRLVPEDPKGKAGTAQLTGKDSTFSTKVVAGKYKVVVTITPYAGEKGSEDRLARLKDINNKYSEKESKLSVTIADQPAQQTMTLDLAKGTASSP